MKLFAYTVAALAAFAMPGLALSQTESSAIRAPQTGAATPSQPRAAEEPNLNHPRRKESRPGAEAATSTTGVQGRDSLTASPDVDTRANSTGPLDKPGPRTPDSR
jgi:hypothetical protein